MLILAFPFALGVCLIIVGMTAAQKEVAQISAPHRRAGHPLPGGTHSRGRFADGGQRRQPSALTRRTIIDHAHTAWASIPDVVVSIEHPSSQAGAADPRTAMTPFRRTDYAVLGQRLSGRG